MNKQKTLEVQLKKNRGENKNQSYSRKCHKRDQFTEKKKLTLNKINPNKIYFDLDHASNSKRQIVNQVKIKNENRSEIEVSFINDSRLEQIFSHMFPDFLQQLAQYYSFYIYTAYTDIMLITIVNYLDPLKEYISRILNRFNCMETKNGFFRKIQKL